MITGMIVPMFELFTRNWGLLLQWLVMIILLLIVVILMEKQKKNFFSQIGVFCPTTWPIFGALPDIRRTGILESDIEGLKKYGKLYGTYLGTTPTLVVAEPEMLKEIMIRQFNNFPTRMRALFVSKWWDNGVVMAEGDRWKYMRSLLSPSFSTGKIKRMHQMASLCLDSMVDYMNGQMDINNNNGNVLDMRMIISALSMDIIFYSAFGIEMNSFQDPENDFAKHAKIVSTLNIESKIINVLPLIMPKIRSLFNMFDLDYVDKTSLDYMKTLMRQIVDTRREQDGEQFNDTLQNMINAHKLVDDETTRGEGSDVDSNTSKNRPLTDDELIANAIIILMSGYDTTTASITWMNFLMAKNQHIQDKLVQEIQATIGNRNPTYEDLQKLEYLDMFFSETLRLYPSANRTGREAAVDTVVCGHTIPQGLSITVPIYALHHDPEYWDQPEECIPERFSRENKHKINPYVYMPFGVGPRACIGTRMAQMTAKIVVVKLLQHYRLEITEDQEMPPVLEKSLLTKPLNGMSLRVLPREPMDDCC